MPRMPHTPPESRADKTVAAYLKQIGRKQLLKPSEEGILLTRAQAGDRKAMNALILGNLRFVVSVCLRFRGRGIPLGDLINEGNLGLIKAVERFDRTKGYRFISYAVWWIRQGIFSALSNQAGFMSVPSNWAMERAKVRKVEQKLFQTLGRPPRREELSEKTGLSAGVIAGYLDPQPNCGTSSVLESGEEGSLGRIAQAAPDFDPYQDSMGFLFRKRLDQALSGLSEREGLVLRRFFGIGTGAPSSLEEISCKLGLSRERVRQIKDAGLAKLRHPARRLRIWSAPQPAFAISGFNFQARRL